MGSRKNKRKNTLGKKTVRGEIKQKYINTQTRRRVPSQKTNPHSSKRVYMKKRKKTRGLGDQEDLRKGGGWGGWGKVMAAGLSIPKLLTTVGRYVSASLVNDGGGLKVQLSVSPVKGGLLKVFV